MEHKREEWLHFLKKAHDFRKERLKIERKSPGPYCVLHLIPMPSTGQESVDIEFISKDYENFITFKENHPIKPPRQNQNGLLIETNIEDRVGQPICSDEDYYYPRGWQRTQIFYSGALEFVYAPPIQGRKEKETKYLSLHTFEFFRLQINNFIRRASDWGFSGAGVIGVTILYAKGYSIYTPIISSRYLLQLPHKIPDDANEVLNSAEGNIESEVRIESIQNIKNDIDERVLQPVFDNVWRYFGFFECDRNFRDGSWNLQP